GWAQVIVYVERVHALIKKAQVPGDRRTCGQRFTVAPHDVFEDALANPDGPVRCLAFVGTTRGGLSRLQELHTDILLRNVIAKREPRLDQELGTPGVRNGY